MDMLIALIAGYACGSIPFGYLLARAAGLGDVRRIGSGNIGATNVLRTGNRKVAVATLVLDLLKGFLPVFLAAGNYPQLAGFVALGAVLGHCFPIWLGFKGGKGVATTAGVSFGLAWPIGLAYAAVWLGMLAVTRISSLGGICAVIAAPVAAWLLGYPAAVPCLAAIAVLVIWLHRVNILRLRQGTEPRVGSGGKA